MLDMTAHFLFSLGGRSAVVVEHSALSSLQKLSGLATSIDVAKQPTFPGPLSPGDKSQPLSLVPVPGGEFCPVVHRDIGHWLTKILDR
jgi:hypothetical protein